MNVKAMKKLLLAILLTVISTNTMAEWIWVGDSANGEFSINVNFKSIRKNKNLVKMWYLKDYKSPRINDSNQLSTAIQTEFDCKNETVQILAITHFSDNLGNGSSVFSGNGRVGSPEPILPDSIDEYLWKIACGKK